MRRLLVRLLAAVLVCEGVVPSLLAAAFFILERMAGGLSFDRRDGLAAAQVFWLLGLASWPALRFASPRPKEPSSRGRHHQPQTAN